MSNNYTRDMLQKRVNAACMDILDKPVAPRAPEQTAAQRLGTSDDLPAIKEAHQSWWQVRRTESENGVRRCVLIFEHRDENTAIQVCGAQKYHCRLTKWGSKAKPYENWKPVKVIA